MIGPGELRRTIEIIPMSCFRPCDIRGKFPDEINEELFHQVGRGIALKFLDGAPVLVGCDVRPSSVPLKEALIAGLLDEGAHVFDADRVPTPVIYFGRSHLPVGAAAIITASHNPPEYNGLKLLLRRYPATAEQIQGLKPGALISNKCGGHGVVESVDLSSAYVDHIVRKWKERLGKLSAESSFRFVLDPGNGAWALLAGNLFQRLGLDAPTIHAEADGRFPNRSPDCALPESLEGLRQSVHLTGANLGVAWDGDGDRVAICDENGKVLSSDQLTLLLLPGILSETIGEKVLYDVKMSEKVRAAIVASGGIPVLERSAHCAIERTMIGQDCLFGCEYSGHFFFRELAGADDGMHAALLIVHSFLKERKPLSERIARLPRLFITPDIRLPGNIDDLSRIERRIAQELPITRIERLDGLKAYCPGGWMLVRSSVSESKLTFRLEGETAEDLQSMIDLLKNVIPEYSSTIMRWTTGSD